MKKYRSSVITLFIIVLSVFLLTKCINNEKGESSSTVNSEYNEYAGSTSCMKCHKNIYDTHIHTAHFHTSEIASEKSIMGSFDTSKNKFVFNNGGVVAMEKRADGLYQVAYVNGVERKSQRFDIVIGSGTKGQSYATWSGNKLYQLPITYFTKVNQWCNSPGYPDKIIVDRPITSRCLECHITYAEKISPEGTVPEEFDKNRLILGVDCERCHGPAAKHVEFQTQNPNDTIGKFIINPATFSRQQSLDMCALCHGGRLDNTKPSFTFTAGDKLSDYFTKDTTTTVADLIDVHGNQYGLLKLSKCFMNSETLTCVTCHNTHENEKGNVALFSQRCMSCHNDKHAGSVICKMTSTIGPEINKNCTNCHMPEQVSMAITVLLQGNRIPTPATMHTHLITIYPDATKKVLAFLKNEKRISDNSLKK